jgi:hypothetical protein
MSPGGGNSEVEFDDQTAAEEEEIGDIVERHLKEWAGDLLSNFEDFDDMVGNIAYSIRLWREDRFPSLPRRQAQ